MWIIAGRPLSGQNLGLTPITGKQKRSADLFLRSAVRPPMSTKSRGPIEQVRATFLRIPCRKTAAALNLRFRACVLLPIRFLRCRCSEAIAAKGCWTLAAPCSLGRAFPVSSPPSQLISLPPAFGDGVHFSV